MDHRDDRPALDVYIESARPGSACAGAHSMQANWLVASQHSSWMPLLPLTPFFRLPLRGWAAPARPLSNHSTAVRVWMWTVRLTFTPHTHTLASV
jgi:hypothetical protein